MSLTAHAPEPKGVCSDVPWTERSVHGLGRRLLAWYDRHRRDLPWRARPGEARDPYRVWLSEIMLQQTTVATAIPYYLRFLARFPTVQALATADLDDVLRLWAGLGYYARARNLHACARAVVERHGGIFPRKRAELRALPGIGAYTAAAIAAIAFDESTVPVDGNVERVTARLFAIEAAAQDRAVIGAAAQRLAPARRAGDFAQALMDLGASLCRPKNPSCPHCPVRADCAAGARGDAETFPAKKVKKNGRLRRGAAFVVVRADGCLLLRTRPANGLLGGLTEVPTTEWRHDFDPQAALAAAPDFYGRPAIGPAPRLNDSGSRRAARAGRRTGPNEPRSLLKTDRPHPEPCSDAEKERLWRRMPGSVTHVFTHFPLELLVFVAHAPCGAPAPAGMRWVAGADLAGEALPSLMRKVIAHARAIPELKKTGPGRAEKGAPLTPAAPAPRRAARQSR